MTQSKSIKISDLIAKTYQPVELDRMHMVDMGGRGCTKSSKNAILIIFLMQMYKDLETIVIRQDAVHHRGTTLRELQVACERLGLIEGINYKIKYSPMQIQFSNGSIIHFGHLSEHWKLKGFKPSSPDKYFGIVWFFEIGEFTCEYDMQQAISTFIRGGDKPIFHVIYEGNPPEDEFSWVYEWIDKVKANPNFRYDFRTYLDLTDWEKLNWLGKQFLDEIENTKKYSLEIYNHIYLGMKRTLDGRCYPNQPTYKERPEKFDYLLAGLDYGESDATSCVVIGVKGDDYYLFKEYYHSGRNGQKKNILQYKSEIAEFLNEIYEQEQVPFRLTVESSPMTVYTLFTSDKEIRQEIQIKKVKKEKTFTNSKDAIQERIDVTNILINSGHLFYCDETMPVIKALKQAIYKKGKRLDDGTTNIDSLDAKEYALKSEHKYIMKNLGVRL